MYSLKAFLLFSTTALLFNAIELTSAKNWAVIVVGLDWYKYTYAYEVTKQFINFLFSVINYYRFHKEI